MFKITFTAILLHIPLSMQAQRLVTLQHAGTSTFFRSSQPLADAYSAAVDGDTIIVPGGVYTSLNVNKSITMLGEGYRPDSTTVNGQSVITGDIEFNDNSDGARLEGFLINGNVRTGYAQKADNLIIRRCEFNNFSSDAPDRNNTCNNVLLAECIINGNVSFYNTFNSILSNNIIEGALVSFFDGQARNNILLGNYYFGYPYYNYFTIYNCQNSVFSNNIFWSSGQPFLCDNVTFCQFNNSIFTGTPDFKINNANFSNYINQSSGSIFVNNASGSSYNYSSNFHLITPSSYPGDDTQECGIYGGYHPFKDGGVPLHPHWINAYIDAFTNPGTGDVQVTLKVSSQNQ